MRDAASTPTDGPPDERAGMRLARRIEQTVERLHTARAHARRAPRSRRRRRAIRQVRKVAALLAALQTRALDGDLAGRPGHLLLAHLVAIDAIVERFLDAPPRRRALRRVRRALKKVRGRIREDYGALLDTEANQPS